MALKVISRIGLYRRISHYGRGIADRYRLASTGVNGAIVQAYCMEPCSPQNMSYHNSSSRADDWFFDSTSRIVLATATGVVLVLGSAGKCSCLLSDPWSRRTVGATG